MGLFDIFRKKPTSILDALHSLPDFKKQKELFDALNLLCEDGIDADEMPNGQGEFGMESTNPIPCKTVFGSTAYLGRLRTLDGTKVVYERSGSIMTDLSPHPIDMYKISHPNGQKLTTLYISPYQKRVSRKAPQGFSLFETLVSADANSTNSVADPKPSDVVVTEPNGDVKYYSNGVLHRDDGPAEIEVYTGYDGDERHCSWYRHGVRHRDDGPAVVGGRTANGDYEWWRDGVRHRDDGPAIIKLFESEGGGPGPTYEWWRNGVLQKRQDEDGVIYYYRDGEEILIELPDGCRIVNRNSEYRFEDIDGNELEERFIPEAYAGYLERNEPLHPLYREPESTFDTYNPATRPEKDI
jgi:hypothetical protein